MIRFSFIVVTVLGLANQAAAETAIVPDPQLTPGETCITDKQKICTTKWGKDERAVTQSMKLQVYKEYGVDVPKVNGKYQFPRMSYKGKDHSAYEVDHLRSREIGGCDSLKNLWLQPYFGVWSAFKKDRLENRIHKEYCANHIDQDEANKELDDWQNSYIKYFGNPSTLTDGGSN